MLLPLRNLGAKHKLRWFSFCLCLSSLAPHPSPRGSPDPAPCVHTCDAGRDEGGRPCLSPRFPWKGAPLSQERGSGAGHWNLGRKVSATQNPSKVCPMSLRRCFQRQPVRLNTELSRPGAQQSRDVSEAVLTLCWNAAETGVMNQLGLLSPAVATERAPSTCSSAPWKYGGCAPLRGNPETKQSNRPG